MDTMDTMDIEMDSNPMTVTQRLLPFRQQTNNARVGIMVCVAHTGPNSIQPQPLKCMLNLLKTVTINLIIK